jgi:hypothetical protein
LTKIRIDGRLGLQKKSENTPWVGGWRNGFVFVLIKLVISDTMGEDFLDGKQRPVLICVRPEQQKHGAVYGPANNHTKDQKEGRYDPGYHMARKSARDKAL